MTGLRLSSHSAYSVPLRTSPANVALTFSGAMKQKLAHEKQRLQASKERELSKALDKQVHTLGELPITGRDILKLIGESWVPCTCCTLPEALSGPDHPIGKYSLQEKLKPLIEAGYLRQGKRPGLSWENAREEWRWGLRDAVRGLFITHETIRLTTKGRQAANARPEASVWEPPVPVASPPKPLDSDSTNYPGQ